MKELTDDAKVDEPEVEPVAQEELGDVESAPVPEPEAEPISENADDEVMLVFRACNFSKVVVELSSLIFPSFFDLYTEGFIPRGAFTTIFAGGFLVVRRHGRHR